MKTVGLWIAIGAAACGDARRELTQARTEPGGTQDVPSSPAAPDAGRAPSPREGAAGPSSDEEPDSALSGGAIPAWQAVIDRDRYLARRGQAAVIAGRIGGDAIAPGAKGTVRWLIDETEGNGSLAVRLGIVGPVPAEGARITTRGAWAVDHERRWYWQAESWAPLDTPAPPPPVDPPAPPGHQIADGRPPPGWKSLDKAVDGAAITFAVMRTPVQVGDGWLIRADNYMGGTATLLLPGERPSYGGHDLRQPDEYWKLARATTYWVRIGKIRKRTADAPPVIRAVSAPVKMW